MRGKVLFVATVLRGHMLVFHLPYMQWFQQQGYEVHCCAGNDTGEEPAVVPYCDRYIETAFNRNPFHPANLTAYRQLKALVETEDYTLIHCHTPVGAMLCRLAAREVRRQGTRVCYTAHGFHFFRGAPLKNWLLYYSAERYLAHFTDLLITINQEDYIRARRFAVSEVELVHGVGVDLTRFDKPVDRAAIRQSFAIDDKTPIIMSVGEHTERKNHALCIQAFAKLDGAVLVFCGVGKQESELKQLAEELHVTDRVFFLGFRKDVAELLQAADIFCFPSLHEGLPVALMEAMAAGLPCVVSAIRGNADLIISGEGGYLYQPSDVDGFADGLQTLLQNPSLRKRFGEYNRKAVQQYGLPSVLKRMGELYQKQLDKRGER